jgi:hypothetical protein
MNLLGVIGINLLLTISVPFIDLWGHAGGLLGGLALGWALTPVYRVDRDGTTIPLTAPGTDSTNPVVSPDGTRVAFLRKGDADDAKAQVHLMRLDGGEPECLTDLPLGASGPRWVGDGTARFRRR